MCILISYRIKVSYKQTQVIKQNKEMIKYPKKLSVIRVVSFNIFQLIFN